MTEPSSADRLHADLMEHGYRDIEEIKGLRVGDRVHHVGERFDRALSEGTAVILYITERAPSSWVQAGWGKRDVEIIVRRDRDGEVSQWADYHTCVPYSVHNTGASA